MGGVRGGGSVSFVILCVCAVHLYFNPCFKCLSSLSVGQVRWRQGTGYSGLPGQGGRRTSQAQLAAWTDCICSVSIVTLHFLTTSFAFFFLVPLHLSP